MKLIRSKYKEIIPEEELLIQDCDKQRKLFLKKKLNEEIQELKDSKYKDVQEYADVIQVLVDLGEMHGIDYNNIITTRLNKKQEFGDFSEGVYLKHPKES